MKTLKRIESQSKEPFFIPRSVQDVIPIHRIWDDGIFQIGAERKKPGAIKQFFLGILRKLGLNTEKDICYSKTFRFEDINYAVASKEDKESMFLEYSEFLNSFDSSAAYKISIIVRKLDKEEFKKAILIPMKGDALDVYRKEYNKIMLDEATGTNGFVQQKYITVSVFKKSVDEARNYFSRVSSDLTAHLNRLGSRAIVLDVGDRLRILHDFFRPNEESGYNFDMKDSMQKGHSFKDFICPDTFEFEKDHFIMGDKYGRVVFLRDYANYIKDTMVSELCDFNRNMILSIDINPIPTDEAVKAAERINLGVETNIANWQRRQNSNSNFSAIIPYDMELQRKESKEFLDDLTTRDQRMMFATMTVVLTADTKEEVNEKAQYQSATTKEDCRLCGNNPNDLLQFYFGENNVGVLDLNTFNFSRLEINRYDDEHNLIEEKAGYSRMFDTSTFNGGITSFSVHSDRGYADGTISIKENSKLSFESLSAHLCSDCLTDLMNEYTYAGEHWNIALINFADKKIRPLEESLLGFSFGDFYIKSRYEKADKKIDLIILYCPVRYK